MIGYILIVFATLCGNAKGFAGKKSSEALTTLSRKLYFGAVRTGMCALLGLCIWLCEGAFCEVGADAILISVVSGLSQGICMLVWITAVRSSAYVKLDIFCQAGMVIPCIFAAPLLGETVSVWQYIALGVLVVAIILVSDKGKNKCGKMKLWDLFLLITVWVTSGLNSLTIKLYANVVEDGKSLFNLITFAVAAAFFFVYFLFSKKEGKMNLPKKHYFLYMPIMVVALYLYTFLQVEAAKYLDAMIMFPLQTVLGLLVSALMAVLLFKEKLTAKNIVGMVLSAASIVAMNML